jgi:hypothetical protein
MSEEKIPDVEIGEDMLNKMTDLRHKIVLPKVAFLHHHELSCSRNRAQFNGEYPNLIEAHSASCSALMNFVSRIERNLEREITEEEQGQLTLATHFIQGINLCETAVLDGYYAQAAPLVRQQHETISAFQEFSAGRRKDGKTPHASIGMLAHLGRIYSNLTGVAHMSNRRTLEDLVTTEVDGIFGPSVFPIYRSETARSLFIAHTCYILMMISLTATMQMSISRQELSENEMILIRHAYRILEDTGFVEFER